MKFSYIILKKFLEFFAKFQSSLKFCGFLSWSFIFEILHIFSIILMSRDCRGQISRIVKRFSQKQFWVFIYLCAGPLSCWKSWCM